MYEDAPPALRFLVADEVGLGKTLVAQGIVARVVDRLWDTVPRIDIVYICSNANIARQNIDRLNLTGSKERALPDRITLLPKAVRNLKHRRLNFISFTPGTSFNLRSSLGTAEERALLYWLLPDDWRSFRRGAISLLAGNAQREGFEQGVAAFLQQHTIDQQLRDDFRAVLARKDPTLVTTDMATRFRALAEQLGGRERLTDEERAERSAIIGELRMMLATACIEALEPDLVILDEFQRFKDLLHGNDQASQLARHLYAYPNTRVLLLSATPYKWYTLDEEADRDDHYTDFLRTVRFLQHDETSTARFREELASYRQALYHYGMGERAALRAARTAVEDALRRVMVRTERLAVTPDRSGMLSEVPIEGMALEPSDLSAYLALHRVASTVQHSDIMEHWKSAPYALNFMDDYQLKRDFREAAAGTASEELFRGLVDQAGALLSWADIRAYRQIDPANARLRALLRSTLDRNAWRVFWLPPSLPYYRLEPPYDAPGVAELTKRLVFSAWQMVPKVVSALLSYEAERRLFGIPEQGEPGANTPETRERRQQLLRFSISQGRLTGMPSLGLLYPSITLATIGDPLRVVSALRTDGRASTLAAVLRGVQAELEQPLSSLPSATAQSGEPDERWYWAAPILLDLTRHEAATRLWFGQSQLAQIWRIPDAASRTGRVTSEADTEEDRDSEGGWPAHVEEARKLVRGDLRLGAPPSDLSAVLAQIAVASPAVAALRALCRVTGGLDRATDLMLRNAAGQIAEGFRSLFNQPEVIAFIRRANPAEPYWLRVVEYCGHGCLQATLDEYAHMLVDWAVGPGKTLPMLASTVATYARSALRLRAATVSADAVELDGDTKRVSLSETKRMFRSRFAARYGGRTSEEEASAERQEQLRRAFNSPFWPFVLCSTSVGQEGLDFHLYCHAVVHWNLPSNPVDLEQREGRVHRFKGHAVRKNLAHMYGEGIWKSEATDPWAFMFREAHRAHRATGEDLVPFWVFPLANGARIERHVPALPLSRDAERAAGLRRALTVYRMAFGQSRQEDLLSYLLRYVPADAVQLASEELRINLSPYPSAHREESGDEPDLSMVTGGESDALTESPEEPWQFPGGRVSLDRLNELLDHYLSLTRERLGGTEHRQVQSSTTIRRLSELLDLFIATRPIPPSTARVSERYRALLGEFVAKQVHP